VRIPDAFRPLRWEECYEHQTICYWNFGGRILHWGGTNWAGAADLPSVTDVQDAKVKKAMDLLETTANKLGPAKIEGSDVVGGKQVPAIYFGSTKINNNFDLVDDVVKQSQVTATIFVRSGDEFVQVATNVKKDDGSRAVGTVLDPKGKVIDSIQKNQAFHGEADIFGKPYITEYKPIRDSAQNIIGIYYVGYRK